MVISGRWHHPKAFPFSMEFTVVADGGTLEYHSSGTPLTLYRADGEQRRLPFGSRYRALVLHTLFYGDEVRVADEAPADLGLVDDKALELAKMLVNAQKGTFDPKKLKDKFRQRVLEVVASRTQSAVPGSAPSSQRESAPAVDIMDALRLSLDTARKPPQSEAGATSPRKKAKRGAK